MGLDVNSINKILHAPQNKKVISRAEKLEQRLRFHTETNVAESDIYAPTQDFLMWVSGLIPKDKFNTFLQLFSFPLPTPAIVEDVYRELERVFYSRNSSCTYQFTDSTLSEDWRKYRTEVLQEPIIWRTTGWQKMKVAVNSILIVDLPKEQKSERPAPYFYWLDIKNVIDFSSKDGESFEWLIFKQDDLVIGEKKFARIAVFDNEAIAIYILNEKGEIANTESYNKHNLGFCPARFYWSTNLTESQKSLKKNPITKELSNLDWLLFFTISKRHLDLYAPYPIYSAYEADCSFQNNETGDYCDGGFLRNEKGDYKISTGGLLDRCPVCTEKRIAGPGSFIEVPTPSNEAPDMREPVQITTVDAESLTYNVKECIRLKNDIIVSCVGSDGLVSEKEAINETQVAANFESKTSVLNALKTNLEKAQRFVEETICKLRYGSDFLTLSVNLGTEFYVLTVDELYEKYKTAKANGSSEAELDALINKILETEYKHNPIELQRMQILKQVEPYRHYTLDEVLKLYNANLLNERDVKLKINFSAYVDKFERENGNIVEFASLKPLYEKIDLLIKQLYIYVDNTKTTTVSAEREAGGNKGATAERETAESTDKGTASST